MSAVRRTLTSRSATSISVALATIFLLTVPTIAYANSKQSFQFTITGGFLDVAKQTYHQSGGDLVSASVTLPPPIGTVTIPPSAKISYSLDAKVDGNAVSGSATLSIKAGKSEGGNDGANIDDENNGQSASNSVEVEVKAQLGDMIGLPLKTSAIPLFFTGLADVKVEIGDTKTTDPGIFMIFESAYANPFGQHLYMGTPDGLFAVVATYTKQTNKWSGVQIVGDILDANVPVGTFFLTSSLVENLVKGTEKDTGQMVLSFFDPSSNLNSQGTFKGKSVVPQPGIPCDWSLPPPFGISLPLPLGTCSLTGSQSTGSFSLVNKEGTPIKGTYKIEWLVPAVGFEMGHVEGAIGEDSGDSD